MNSRRLVSAAALVSAGALTSGAVLHAGGAEPQHNSEHQHEHRQSQDHAHQGMSEMQEAMAEWAKYAQPGEHHELLEPLVGTWDAKVSMWMSPEAPPNVSSGTMTNEWMLGGRFLKEEFESEFMGQQFKGFGLFGYDRIKEKYVGLWCDTMMTSMLSSAGEVDETGKVFTMRSVHFDPAQQRKVRTKDVVRVINNDKHMMTMHHETPDGEWMKVMEIVYTRK